MLLVNQTRNKSHKKQNTKAIHLPLQYRHTVSSWYFQRSANRKNRQACRLGFLAGCWWKQSFPMHMHVQIKKWSNQQEL